MASGLKPGMGTTICRELCVPLEAVTEPLTRTKKCFQSADYYSLVSQRIPVVSLNPHVQKCKKREGKWTQGKAGIMCNHNRHWFRDWYFT